MTASRFWNTVDPPRDLDHREREAIEFLLSASFPGNEGLRKQLEHCRVRGESASTDPSIQLSVDHEASRPVERMARVPVDALAFATDRTPIHLLLHVTDGSLDELEVYRADSRVLERVPSRGELQGPFIVSEDFEGEVGPAKEGLAQTVSA